MAAFGFGVGDLIAACNAIHDLALKYKDAPKEFDEIAEKAKSTAVVLSRIDREAATSGNLVERAGPEAVDQLETNLESLRKDSDRLEDLVRKYNKIHDDGYGRRLLFALKESGDLTDLRRRIGLHEQTLQLWYMTLITSSLRRIEGGQAEILEGIRGIDGWDEAKFRRMQDSILRNQNFTALANELKRMGVGVIRSPQRESSRPQPSRSHRSRHTSRHRERIRVERRSGNDSDGDSDDDKEKIDPTVLRAMSEYIVANPRKKEEMKSILRTNSILSGRSVGPIVFPPPDNDRTYRSENPTGPRSHEELYRSRSAGHERRDQPDIYDEYSHDTERRHSSDDRRQYPIHTSNGHLAVPGESFRPRRVSLPEDFYNSSPNHPPQRPRSSSNRDQRTSMQEATQPSMSPQREEIIIREDLREERSRSNSRLEVPNTHSRHGSAHSYERRRRSQSRNREDQDDDFYR